MPPFIHENSCKKCFRCLFGSAKGEVPQVFYPDECWHCNACVIECPHGAMELRIPLDIEPVYQEK